MNKLTFIVIFLCTSFVYAQTSKVEYKNFKLQSDKSVIWQKVYDMEVSKDSIIQILNNFKNSNKFLNKLEFENDTFTGMSNDTKISDLKGLPFAVHTDFNCFVKIEVKDERYRVTISDVKFKPINMDVGMIEMDSNFILEDVVVRDNHNEIRKNKMARKVLSNLNDDFLNLLQLKEIRNDDW